MTRTRNGGFTLTELVIVMVVIAILAAIVMVRVSTVPQHSVTTQADQLRRDLSHVQLLAISTSARLRLSVAGNGLSYTVTSCATSTCPVSGPVIVDPATGQNFTVVLTDGVTLAPTGNDLDFDSLGRPQSAGSLIDTAGAARTYTLSGSGRTVTVSVLPVTGFAQTTY